MPNIWHGISPSRITPEDFTAIPFNDPNYNAYTHIEKFCR